MLLVDAFNVLHVTGVLPPDLAGPDVGDLADLIARSRWRAGGAMLVCDGPGPKGAKGRASSGAGGVIQIRYAGVGRDADSLIERLLQRHSAPRRVTVVSSDRRLKHAARSRKARWMPSEEFLRRLAHDARRPAPESDPYRGFDRAVPLSDGAVEAWIRDFGVPEAERRRPVSESPRIERPSRRRKRDHPPRRDDAPPAPGASEDDLLREAMREWPGRIDPDDLNMSRWLDGPEFDPDASKDA